MTSQTHNTGKSHAPKDSVMFEKAMPVLLVALGVLTVLLIGFAAALLLGFIHL